MKFQPSAIAATNLSGKSGGTVATITNTFRRKSNPRQPNSAAQLAVRSRFSSLSTGWGSLTEEQQNAWIAAAPNFILFKHGEAYTLKGNTLYQRLNNNLLRAGQEAITLPPMPGTFPYVTASSIDCYIDEDTGEEFAALFTDPVVDITGFTAIGLATHPFNPGKRAVDNLMLELGPVTWAEGYIPFNADYEDFFADWVDGKRVQLGFYLINNSTGQASQVQTMQTVIYTGI
jgi:hypothetical protein